MQMKFNADAQWVVMPTARLPFHACVIPDSNSPPARKRGA